MGVGCEPGLPSEPTLTIGLPWMRRRLRALTRAVLALVCLAWLQVAIVPCVMAHADALPEHAPASLEHEHAGHGGHDHAAAGAHDAPVATDHPCLYCPPHGGDGAACGDAGDCAYPHDPQVDARAASAVLAPPLAVVFTIVPIPAVEIRFPPPQAGSAAPPTPLILSFCRFIE